MKRRQLESSSSSAARHHCYYLDAGDAVSKLVEGLDEEFRYEAEEASLSLSSRRENGLRIEECSVGLFGRLVVTLSRKGKRPADGIRSGCYAKLGAGDGNEGAVGLVQRATDTSVKLALDVDSQEHFATSSEDDEENIKTKILTSAGTSAVFFLIPLPGAVTHARMKGALKRLKAQRADECFCSAGVFSALFAKDEDTLQPMPANAEPWTPVNADLNDSQRAAIELGMRSKDVALIHGPPGTGKTTTVVELILQLAHRGLRILVCAPSNVAVDNLLMQLSLAKQKFRRSKKRKGKSLKLVRVGHPARVSDVLLGYSLEAVVEQSDGTSIVQDVKKELKDLWSKRPRKRMGRAEKRLEAKALRKEIRAREKKIVKEILMGAHVVLCTNVGSDEVRRRLNHFKDPRAAFDVVVIDEAAQATEPSCWVPMLLGKRTVLAGDHKQLPPTIKSKAAERGALGLTLFDRAMRRLSSRSVMLNVQYRMNRMISDWSSEEMYGGNLLAAESVMSRTLGDIDGYDASDEEDPDAANASLLLLDTSGCDYEETEEDSGPASMVYSRKNEGEARIVVKHVTTLLRAGLLSKDIAVVTPYNGQVGLLRELLGEHEGLEIRSVDGFQGREKEAVVLSLVRSNRQREVGFLGDDRRMNVAITRAKRHVCVVCDADTIRSGSAFLGRVCAYFEEHGQVRCAETYLDPTSHFVPAPAIAAAPPKPRGYDKDKQTRHTEARRREFESALRALKGGKDEKIEFPASLLKWERREIHSLCESLGGLLHVSEGDGSKRRLTVTRILPLSEKTVVSPKEKGALTAETDQVCTLPASNRFELPASDHDASDAECDEKSDNQVGDANGDDSAPSISDEASEEATAPSQLQSIREIQAQRFRDHKEKAEEAAKSSNKQKKRRKKKKKKKSEKSRKTSGDGFASMPSHAQGLKPALTASGPADIDDDMAFLDAVLEASKKCAKRGCKTSVQTIGLVCRYCNQKFCTKHIQGETHGCAKTIRTNARQTIRSGIVTQSAPTSLSSGKWKAKSKLLSSSLKKAIGEKSGSRVSEAAKKARKKKKKGKR